MKLLKKMAVLGLVVLALAGCTKSSLDDSADPMGQEEMDPDKLAALEDDEETLPREENFLVFDDDELEKQSLYEWDQVRDDAASLFSDAERFPQGVKMDFTANEDNMAITLSWVLKNDTTEQQAMDYAATLVQEFNDIVAVQSVDMLNSNDTSFGGLWNEFSLDLTISKEDGTEMLKKSYKARDKIDLVIPKTSEEEGPEEVEEDVPKKV